MSRKLKDIKIIGIGLTVLYGVSFLVYLNFLVTAGVSLQNAVMTILLGGLFVGSIAVVRLKEWGRVALIVGNAVMGIYLLIPFLVIENLIPVSFIFMNVALLLFFNQGKIKAYFTSRGLSKINQWKSVLLVDDDPTLINSVRPVLISHGYSVLSAENGEDGLTIARTQKPDMIILDVILPGIKGREVCKCLKEDVNTRDIPVIFLTAKDSPDDVEAEKELGAIGHLTKPVTAKLLIETVHSVLNR